MPDKFVLRETPTAVSVLELTLPEVPGRITFKEQTRVRNSFVLRECGSFSSQHTDIWRFQAAYSAKHGHSKILGKI